MKGTMKETEDAIVAGLVDAQRKANELFKAVETQNFIRPGQTELQINEAIYKLAAQTYGITRYWHKRIVRAGRNTLVTTKHENRRELRDNRGAAGDQARNIAMV